MLAIRLSRVGTKNKRKFRVIVQEKGASPKRGFLEIIGHYDPEAKPHVFVINKERYDHWVGHGAKPSDTLASLIKRDPSKMKERKKKSKKQKAAEAAAKEAAAKEAEAKAAQAATAPTETPTPEAPASEAK